MTAATTGFGALLKRGDGGVGAGTQASRTISTGNQQIIIKAKTAGAAGNSKTCSIVVSGNNTAFSFTVTATNLVITSATDGSGLATTKVGQCISALYADATFDANWQATVGAGDGSGVLVAASSASLTGGADGAEVFTTIAEVKNIAGPNMQAGVTDVTNMDSTSNTREFLSTLVDPGQLTFGVNYLPTNAAHVGLISDLKNRVRRNFRLIFTDAAATTSNFAGLVIGFDITAAMEEAILANVTVKVTGFPSGI